MPDIPDEEKENRALEDAILEEVKEASNHLDEVTQVTPLEMEQPHQSEESDGLD